MKAQCICGAGHGPTGHQMLPMDATGAQRQMVRSRHGTNLIGHTADATTDPDHTKIIPVTLPEIITPVLQAEHQTSSTKN